MRKCLPEVLRSAATSIGILDNILKMLDRIPFACLHGYAPADGRYCKQGCVLLLGLYRTFSLELVSGRDVKRKPPVVVPRPFQPDRYLRIAQAKSDSEAVDIVYFLSFEQIEILI